MVVKSMNSYIADELANKVKYLHFALDQAQNIIDTLQTENFRLKDVLMGLASENNKDLIINNEEVCV